MQKNEFFSSLGNKSGLFYFTKQELDLLILAQLNTITISQLHTISLHGDTLASTRLSLNRLVKKELVTKRNVPNHNNAFYFTLTTKAKEHLKQVLPEELLESLEINWERKPPVGSQQLLHRILANDFYCSFLSMPTTLPSVWKIEEPLNHSCDYKATQPPRADGFLSTTQANYYIEQDNHSQSEPVLHQKIKQYQENGIFNNSNRKKILVFTLASSKNKRTSIKSSYTVYRLLVKVCKVWNAFEKEQHLPLDYIQFRQLLLTSSHKHGITESEMMTLDQLHHLHPEFDDIASADVLRKRYLDDTSYLEMTAKDMDTKYQKRLKAAFQSFYDKNKYLLPHAITGNSIFAVPNHRLKQCQPFITSQECNLQEILLKTLFYNGLNIDNWEYHEPYSILFTDKPPMSFARGFFHASCGHIVFELLGADLSAYPRLRHYKEHYSHAKETLVIILLVPEFVGIDTINTYTELFAEHTNVLFTKTLPNFTDNIPTDFYFLHQPEKQAFIECDIFDDSLHLHPKGGLS